MKTTRTQFLVSVATGLTAAAFAPSRLLGAGPETPDLRTFKALVGETLRFQGADGRGPVNLVLTDYAEAAAHPGTTQFTLTLAAPDGDNLREGTYTVDHMRTGTFRMFVIPAGRDTNGWPLYRADFNILATVTGQPVRVKRRP